MFVCTLLMILFVSLTGKHGLLQLAKIDKQVDALKERNQSAKSDIAVLQQKIYDARHSNFFLERLAREELGLSRKGEIVYIFPRKKPDRE